MNILQCDECGSNIISYDVATGTKTCSSCGSKIIIMVSDFEFAKKSKRIERKLDLLSSKEDRVNKLLFPDEYQEYDEDEFDMR